VLIFLTLEAWHSLAALLVFCKTEESLEATTGPQQQNTGATKDLCEVQR
jgi:hypothetical protein